ncbi:MAG: DUF2306 domain-containing protein [Hyphomonadaceae bacterium]
MTAMPTRPARTRWIGIGAVGAVFAVTLVPFGPRMARAFADFELRAPDFTLWAGVSPVVKLHVYAALTALAIGAVILFRPKGRGLHKILGWSWVIAMATTAVSSLFIMEVNNGFFSFIHLLSGWTIIALPMAIFAIRNRKVDVHRRTMTGMFVGGLLVAGLLSFIPGRIMFEMFFG